MDPTFRPPVLSERRSDAIYLAFPYSDRQSDGIRDYSERLLDQLLADGDDVELLRPPPGPNLGRTFLRQLPRHGSAALVIEYNPFSWGRRGFAPSLVWALGLVRLLRPNVRIVLTVHEAYIPILPFRTYRWFLMGLWQWVQMRLVLALAHGAVTAEVVVARTLSRAWPRRRVSHLPVSSNLPDERSARKAVRAREGYSDALVIATFSGGHETHLHNLVTHVTEAVARASSQPVLLLLLGSKNLQPTEVRGVARIVTPGYLDERRVAQALASADLFIAPFADGASTRRGSLMAAMQQGLAIVTTQSNRTEQVLLESGALAFATVGDQDGFASEAVRIAVDAGVRQQYALASRELFENAFAWSNIAGGLRAAIAAAR